ncbi:MAG: DNA polymerase III subunit gamma/tau [Muribaculum sp.]|nr:DNA polymerase III subunit gamma/tau [Muribaculaceae bacterium]MCM1080378.1 DNA polymerase III subunit gamma/tau [Muribaculum sp.]
MENYIVSARKYRPSTFASVVGQKALTTTLQNSIAKNRLAHAYLFTGSRGVGKTSCARIFAKTINCQHRTPDGEACNHCQSCIEFNKGTSLNIVELDAASNNGVDDIRSLTEQVQVPPINALYRVFIVDEVHMLSPAAFNAFLKTLEEPPSYVIFILATTEKHKIIPTILSRCQIYDFSRITIQDIVDHLSYVASQENINAEEAALNVIARKADGAMRDALSIFDQVAASSSGNVTYAATIENLNILDYEYYDRLVEAFIASDVTTSLLIYKEIRDKGFDSQFFINGLAQHFRDLMVARDPKTIQLLEAADNARAAMAAVAAKCTPQFLYKAMDLCNTADLNYRSATNKQFLVELTLIKLCQQLSPSPRNDGADEGQLRPIAAKPREHAPSTPVTTDSPKHQSAPQPPAKPSAASIPTPPAQPKPHVIRNHRLASISINTNPTKEVETTQTAATPTVALNNNFTNDELNTVWQEFILNHPTEHLLRNAMRNCILSRNPQNPNHITATVESEAIRDSIHQGLPLLTQELQTKLKNASILLNIELNKEQVSATSLTDAQAFALMRKNHPYLNTLIADLHLTMI